MQFLTNPIPIGDISEGASGVLNDQFTCTAQITVLNDISAVMLHGNRDDSSRLVPFPQGQMKTLHHLLAASSVSS